MRRVGIVFSIMIVMVFWGLFSWAGQFVSGSTGEDGAFNPTQDVQLQVPPDGIFNFTTVNIPQGVTVTFKKNEANTPVYILATGDVNIAGVINVSGSSATTIYPGKGGPGGFNGGYGGYLNQYGGKGMGPGGGIPGYRTNVWGKGGGGGGAGFSGKGESSCTDNGFGIGGKIYGNSNLSPLIGGSGGGGGGGSAYGTGGAGGGGGGAILIASSGTINITGKILANGGRGANAGDRAGGGGGGSGGAIRLIANVIKGEGLLSATGGSYGQGYCRGGKGANGRIRLETYRLLRTSGSTPGYYFGLPDPVFAPVKPTLKITSVAGVAVPQSPTGSYETPDIILPTNTQNPVTVTIEATNVPVGTVVDVTVMPQFGPSTTVQSTALSGTEALSTATAEVNISTNHPTVIMATATFTLQTAMYYEGEKIEKVRVATRPTEDSKVVYITESGRQITQEQLIAKLNWRK